MVDRLQRHPTGERPIPDDRHHLEILPPHIPGNRHPQRRRNTGRSMARPEMVKPTFRAFQITGNAIFLPQGMELVIPPGNDFVRISLVPHVPDHLIPVQV
jgi:hypothetical protein